MKNLLVKKLRGSRERERERMFLKFITINAYLIAKSAFLISNMYLVLSHFQCPPINSIRPCKCIIECDNYNYTRIQFLKIKDESFSLRKIFAEVKKVNNKSYPLSEIYT